MIIKDFLNSINNLHTSTERYTWHCFGPQSHQLEYWNGKHDHSVSASAVFDLISQKVFQMEVHDDDTKRCYRWTDPEFQRAFDLECAVHNMDPAVVYDDLRFTDLDVVADFLEKCQAIVSGRVYDTRVQVELNLGRDEMFDVMMLAHEQDITLNQLLEKTLQLAIMRQVLP
jgi:hypothetical protein